MGGNILIKKIILTLFFSTVLSGLAAEQVVVKVKGIVCSFCASTIKKSFKKNGFTGKVKVNLDDQTVVLNSEKRIDMKDKKIEQIILDSGYNITSIKRSK